ncbi:hypothetical protein SOCE26_004990 [Sorangium cellulosum]|uniref:PDZ domain-containing protein n=1 Tax=Sorangium cellulosum TaxID=56 RepID=A0A2L0EIL4_SORCE|nr:carboxypeptidase regulatory-like domain-containing protein [Sorangium cellulosum]AUX39117.1 hypothetical protein SOCE26_004990 [Sorangium cellulosum]
MKRSWIKQAWALAVLGLALSALLFWSLWRRPAGAPPTGADVPPEGAAPARPGARPRAPAARARQPGSVAGRVAEPAGAPVAGAMVCATVESGAMSLVEAREPVCAPAAQDGRYTLSGLLPARWRISASAPGHRPAHYVAPDALRAPFLDLGAGEARTGVDLTLAPGGVEVKGQVEDIGGGAISGALVMISRFGPHDVVVARSDAQGSYAAWVDEGPYMARAEADGYSVGFKDGVAPGPALKLLLTPASVLAGRVLEAGTGAPVEGAKISLESEEAFGMMPGAGAAHALSDAEGRFRVDRLPPGRYRILARAVGRFGQARESVVLGVGQTSSEVVVEVHPARTLTGRVEIAPDGAPCKSGNVGLMDTASGGMVGVPVEADGAVRFDGVLPGKYQVLVRCTNQPAEPSYPPVEVRDVDVEGLVWTVRAGLTIRGRVVDRDGGPVRANVHAHAPEMMGRSGATGASASNEPDGSFVLQGLSPAKYMVAAEPIDHVQPEPVEVELRDEHAPEVTIVADRGGAIEGTVTDADRKPVEGVHIMIASPPRMDVDPPRMGPHPPRMNAAVSREDGSFASKGLPPGEYRVWTNENDMTPPPPPGADPLAGGPQAVSATVKAGESARVALVVERRNGEIQGRVVDEIGEPVTDAFVHAVSESEGAAPPGASAVSRARWGAFSRAPVLTDPEGRFVLGGLREGVYTVRAYRKGGGDGIAEHVKTGDSVTLTLQPAGAISGTLSVPGGKVPDNFTVRVIDSASMFFRSETFVFTEGAFTISGLPEGKYSVSTEAQEGTAAVEVPLGPGEHRRGVVLALAPRAAVRGQVVSLDGGAPVAGMNVRIVNRAGGPPMLPSGGREDNLTDTSGRFEVSGVASGRITVMFMPSDPMNSPHDGAAIPFDVQAGGSTDLGRIALPKRRLKPEDPPGDLGYSIKWGSDIMVDIAEMTFEVSQVRSGGPAAAAGLRGGDVIVSVDGHDVRGKMTYLYHPLTTVPSGTQVTLGLARGANVSITAGNIQPPPGMPGMPAYPH